MALPAHSYAEEFISSKEKDTGLQTDTAFLPERQKNEEVFEVWFKLCIVRNQVTEQYLRRVC